MQTTPRKHMSKAVMRVMRTTPFFTSIILKHEFVEDSNVNGIEIDGKEIRYHPEAIMTLTPPELAESLKHCAMHIAYRHHIRHADLKPRMVTACNKAGTTFEEVFDQAADLSINSLLRKNNELVWNSEKMQEAPIPGRGKFEDLSDGCCAEDYAKQVLKIYEEEEHEQEEQPGQNPPPCNGGGGGDGDGDEKGDGDGEGEGQGNSQPDQEDQEDQNDDQGGDGGDGDDGDDEQEDDGSGNGPSGPPSAPSNAPPPKPKPMNFGMVKPSKEEPSKAENDADEMIAAATMAAKAAGEDTGTVNGIIAENEKPVKVNWRAELAQFFEQTVRGRPNYRHVNRRLFGKKMIFPTNKDKSPKKCIILVDVSGSMDDECVCAVYNHVEEIIGAKRNMIVEVVPFDANVFHDNIKEYNIDTIPIGKSDRSRCGWGGTRFMPAVKYAEDEENVSGIIMLTDLLPCDSADFMAHTTSLPWIILSVYDYQFGGRYDNSVAKPKWARTIEIEP